MQKTYMPSTDPNLHSSLKSAPVKAALTSLIRVAQEAAFAGELPPDEAIEIRLELDWRRYCTEQAIATAIQAAAETTTAGHAQDAEPVAIAYAYDGFGWQYIDSGSGSDWKERGMAHDDAIPLYDTTAQVREALDKNGDLLGTPIEQKMRRAFRLVAKHHSVSPNGVLEADMVREILALLTKEG